MYYHQIQESDDFDKSILQRSDDWVNSDTQKRRHLVSFKYIIGIF